MGEKGRNSIMWRYIAEESALLKKRLECDEVYKAAEKLPRLDAVYFIAHGSSFNAALAAADFMADYMQLRVYVYTPNNFIYNCRSIEKEDKDRIYAVAVSQTGTSKGVLDCVLKAKEMGLQVLGITEAEKSPLAAMSDLCLSIGCGEEDSNAKTKGYSCTLLILLRLALEYSRKYATAEESRLHMAEEELRRSIEALEETIDRTICWCEETKLGLGMTHVYVLGQGMNFATAMEGSLKLMETMCIPSMFNDYTEFSHGMHRSVKADSAILLIYTGDANSRQVLDTFSYLMKKTEHTYMINCSGAAIVHDNILNEPCFPLTQSLLNVTASLQVISVFAPECNGKNPNADSNNDYTVCAETRVS